ncbi:methyl-accepting chemotaxis protein [Gammaproteobacteria bacterium LSUCC0112]|nr:methyl-accepting chemotaxis protein [Gammaproteobacteria bacterium LSUCC0112]
MMIILKPAVWLLEQLRFRAKFSLIFVSVLVPLSVLSYFVLKGVNEDVAFLESELRGVEFISVAEKLLLNAHEYRNAVTFGGNLNVDELSQQKTAALQNVTAMATLYGASADTMNLLNDARSRWQEVSQSPNRTGLTEEMTGIIALINHIMRSASNDFKLTLSPDLDTYYLNDSASQRLPTIFENIFQLRQLSAGLERQLMDGIAPGSGLETRLAIEVASSRLEDALASLRENITLAMSDSIVTSPALASATEVLAESVIVLRDAVHRQALSESEFLNVSLDIDVLSSAAFKNASQQLNVIIPDLSASVEYRLNAVRLVRLVDILMILFALIVLVYMFSGLFMSIISKVAELNQTTTRLSSGELTARVRLTGRDEMQDIADGMNVFADRLEMVIKQISNATIQLSSSAEELSSVSRHSAETVLRQRQETDMVAVAINQMTASVSGVSQSTLGASQAAADADSQAVVGAGLAEQAAKSILILSEDINQSAQSMQRVSTDSMSIAQVLDVITGVAEQTNLLALNAAIEAARAGDHGRGFAVVADEVRTLANRTLASASEIDGIIRSLQTGVQEAARKMKNSQEKAGAGVRLATQAFEAMSAITHAVTTISDMNLNIASASNQQIATTEELNRNVTSIRDLAEQSAVGASQATAASEELAKLATQLQASVDWFRVSR